MGERVEVRGIPRPWWGKSRNGQSLSEIVQHNGEQFVFGTAGASDGM